MNAFEQLAAMRGPNVTLILLYSQWGKKAGEWTMTYPAPPHVESVAERLGFVAPSERVPLHPTEMFP